MNEEDGINGEPAKVPALVVLAFFGGVDLIRDIYRKVGVERGEEE